MAEVRVPMPKLTMTMEEGELVSWHKSPGDQVRAGDVLCEVMSDKVEIEVEAPADGVVAALLVEEGATAPVGVPIATLTTESDDLIGDLLDDDPEPQPAAPTGPAPEAERAPSTQPPRRGGLAVAPAARRRASELGVDLDAVTGSGPRGLVRVQDVEAAAAPASAEPAAAASTTATAPPRQQPGGARRTAMRAAIARRMAPSAAVPQFTVFAELDLEELAARRGRTGWTALLLAAAARALRANPQLNATWQGEHVVSAEALRVAVAVDTPNGLLAPVIDAPDHMSLSALDQALRALVDRAKLGKLTLADQQPGTFTLSNLGPLGVPVFQALLTPPQAAALSVGAIEQRAVVRDGAVVAALGCQVGLTVDHRVADGADAARYLATLREQVENPENLLA